LIVWRLKGNIIGTVLYIANVLPLQWAQLTETVHTARLGLEFVFLFLGCTIYLYVHSQGVSASEIAYIVPGGALNSTHSLTHSLGFKGHNYKGKEVERIRVMERGGGEKGGCLLPLVKSYKVH